jgi:hypothetical protein
MHLAILPVRVLRYLSVWGTAAPGLYIRFFMDFRPLCTLLQELVQAGGVEPLRPLRAKGSEHEGHESTRNTRKEALSASRLSCLSRPFAAFAIQTPLELLMPLRVPFSVASALFSTVSDSDGLPLSSQNPQPML